MSANGNGVRVNITIKEVIQYLIMVIGFVSMFFIMRANIESNTSTSKDNKEEIKTIKTAYTIEMASIKESVNKSNLDVETIKVDVGYLKTDVAEIKKDMKTVLKNIK